MTARLAVQKLWRRARRRPPPILTDAVVTTAMKGGQSLLTLLALIVAARWLGPGAYGDLATAIAVAGTLAIALGLGLPSSLLRWVAAYTQDGDTAARRGLQKHAFKAVGLASLAISFLVAVSAAVTGHAGHPFQLGALAAIPLAYLRVGGAWLKAHGFVRSGEVGEALVRPLLLLGLFAGASALALRPASETAMILFIAACLGALGATFWRLPHTTPGTAAPPRFETRRWIASSAPLLGAGLLHALMANTDVLMLHALKGAEAAGVYHMAGRAALAAGLVLAAVNAATGPRLARSIAHGRFDAAGRLARISTRSLAVPAVLAIPLLALGGGKLLAVAGAGFASGKVALLLLWLGQLGNIACGPVAVLLALDGRESAALTGVATGAAVNIGLNAALIPGFGIVGAACATAASTLVWNLMLAAQVRRHMGIDPTVLGRRFVARTA